MCPLKKCRIAPMVMSLWHEHNIFKCLVIAAASKTEQDWCRIERGETYERMSATESDAMAETGLHPWESS